MTKKQAAQAKAVEVLKSWGVAPLTVVYAKVCRVSASGMSRRIQLYTINQFDSTKSEIVNISYWAAKAMGWDYKEGYNMGIAVGGYGMDMLFHTVDCLSRAMGYGDLNQFRGEVGEGFGHGAGLIYRQL